MITDFPKTCFPILTLALCIFLAGCDNSNTLITNQYSAPRASVDRFSNEAGTLFQRSSNPTLPGPNEAIHFDQPPFLTRAYGPDGEIIQQYNFDVMPLKPAPIYVLFRSGEDSPVQQQENIVDVIPGDPGYNDFWQMYRVTVPPDYSANTATSLSDIREAGYEIQETSRIFNCPIVPRGSTANKHFGDTGSVELDRGWYRNKVVYYFTFNEKQLSVDNFGQIPNSKAWVTFSTNPGQQGSEYSGFLRETDTHQTHNVLRDLPESAGYSPLKLISIYDKSNFNMVSDQSSARDAALLQENAALLNYPTVGILPQ